VFSIFFVLITKEVVSSLIMGVCAGVAVYSLAAGISFISSLTLLFEIISTSLANNTMVIIFLSLLGALSQVVIGAGGSDAFAMWVQRKVKSRVVVQILAVFLSFFLSIDDYFNCMTVGTVMQPIIESHNISRAKLAYILDAMSPPICVIMPISSWAATVASCFVNSGIKESGFFLKTIPYNFYSFFNILLIFMIIISSRDFGPMKKFEKNASNLKPSDDGSVIKLKEKFNESEKKGRVLDLVIPVLTLMVVSIFIILATGGFFSGGRARWGAIDSGTSINIGAFCALVVALFLTVICGKMKFSDFMFSICNGIKSMVSSFMILTLAWSMSSLCKNYLMIDQYVGSTIAGSRFPLQFLPLVAFVASAFLSFAVGSSWGTFSMIIPVAVSICASSDVKMLVIVISAVLSGSVFGDHCSPISDSTIMASAASGCVLVDHVKTQLPYALLSASVSGLAFLIVGITGNLLLSFALGIVILILTFWFFTRKKLNVGN
jgi:Na+/H+ antiporter NhaC